MLEASPEQFLAACGATGPLELEVRASGKDAVVRALHQPFAVVGSDPSADVALNEPGLDPFHAYFQLINGRLFCVDLHSRAGARWADGRHILGWVDPLSPVRVGPVRIRPVEVAGVPGPGDNDPYPTSRSFQQAGLPGALLEFPGADPPTPAWRVSRAVVLIGRSGYCKVRLKTPDVSNFHCCLLRTPGGVWLVDIQSPSGTRVNGTPVHFARLEDGDEVRVGDHRLRLRCNEARLGPTGSRSLALKVRGGGEPSIPTPPPRTVGTEIVPFEDPAGTLARATADPEGLLRRLVDEIGRSQQGTAEPFGQMLEMTLRLFVAMHRDQMTYLREELARLNRLNEEQRELMARLSGGQLQSPAAPATADESREGAGPADAPADHPARSAIRPVPVALNTDECIHDLMSRRIADIDNERQGRLQKLIGSLLNGAFGETTR